MKILVEQLIGNEINLPLREIEVYCFNGKPKIFVNVKYGSQREVSVYDENFNQIDLLLHPDGKNAIEYKKVDKVIKQTFDLSSILAREFKFVRVDWIIKGDKLFFNELTFTSYSGMMRFDKKWNKKLGEWLEI